MAQKFFWEPQQFSCLCRKLVPLQSEKRSYGPYLFNPNLESFFISPCTADDVSTHIQSLKLGKSYGSNSILIKLLKILHPPISSDLALIINESFVTGTFPENLKVAKVVPVVPIFKKGLTTITSNYRIISLHSVFSKL